MPLRLLCTDDHEPADPGELKRIRLALEGLSHGHREVLAEARSACSEASAARTEVAAAREEIAALKVMLEDALKAREAVPAVAAAAPEPAPNPVLKPARTSRVKTAATEKDGTAGA